MDDILLPILIFAACATAVSLGMLGVASILGPRRQSAVKSMPYESGMDPIHDAHRKFDVRFHLVAIAFLVFDVELLFLYPWAVASKHASGIDAAVQQASLAAQPLGYSRGLVFAEVMVFIGLLALGFVYAWRKGVFQWR
ncbi:MAG: NADH-quinone oxidoreductase subunit A [Planctomycetaceae bacterium]|nr:NADH-quinone oxidoreductase subunit A [Planctomycetaceae bacterium]